MSVVYHFTTRHNVHYMKADKHSLKMKKPIRGFEKDLTTVTVKSVIYMKDHVKHETQYNYT